MMLPMFSRGSQKSAIYRASGKTASMNGIRNAFFGFFPASAHTFQSPAGMARHRRKRGDRETGFASAQSHADWHWRRLTGSSCGRFARLEGPGCPRRRGDSRRRWSGSDFARDSASDSKVLPERGAATMNSGRSKGFRAVAASVMTCTAVLESSASHFTRRPHGLRCAARIRRWCKADIYEQLLRRGFCTIL